jgi:hypothetical protein
VPRDIHLETFDGSIDAQASARCLIILFIEWHFYLYLLIIGGVTQIMVVIDLNVGTIMRHKACLDKLSCFVGNDYAPAFFQVID